MKGGLILTEYDRYYPDVHTPLWKLWWAFFAYTAITSLVLQLIVLPYIIPAWHAGDGLLVGGDSLSFHHDAAKLAQEIRTHGWSVWELRPAGQAPVGIASAIYFLTVPKPWTIIPLNAALHATAALILLLIMQIFIKDWRLAIWSVLPFFLYPSAMLWYTQIHKDGMFIAGAILFVYGWLLFARTESWSRSWWPIVRAIIFVFLGAVLVWIVRPYGVQMLQGIGALMGIILTGNLLLRGLRAQIQWRKALVVVCLIFATIVLLTPFTKAGIWMDTPTDWASSEAPQNITQNVDSAKKNLTPASSRWKPLEEMNWLTKFLDNKFYALAAVRDGFRLSYPGAKSNIDLDISFSNAKDMIVYVPRGAQIAFLAPFPNQWFGEGSQEANTVMRRVSMLEMIGVYAALAFLPFSVWYWRKRIEMWMVLIFTSSMMLIFALVIPNIGSLYRVRYGFIMSVVALGIVGCIKVFWELRRKHLYNRNIHSGKVLR